MPIRPEMAARYPKDWKLRSRFVRFYRAKNRCEWCGAENYQPHPITGSTGGADDGPRVGYAPGGV